jgi:hypothetical protein
MSWVKVSMPTTLIPILSIPMSGERGGVIHAFSSNTFFWLCWLFHELYMVSEEACGWVLVLAFAIY